MHTVKTRLKYSLQDKYLQCWYYCFYVCWVVTLVIFVIIIIILSLELHHLLVLSLDDATFCHYRNMRWYMRGFLSDTGGWIGKVSLPNYVTDVTSTRIFVFSTTDRHGQGAPQSSSSPILLSNGMKFLLQYKIRGALTWTLNSIEVSGCRFLSSPLPDTLLKHLTCFNFTFD